MEPCNVAKVSMDGLSIFPLVEFVVVVASKVNIIALFGGVVLLMFAQKFHLLKLKLHHTLLSFQLFLLLHNVELFSIGFLSEVVLIAQIKVDLDPSGVFCL